MASKSKRAAAVDLAAALASWTALNAALMKLEEADVRALLEAEQRGANRLTFTLRIHARLSKLRRERERRALVQERRAS